MTKKPDAKMSAKAFLQQPMRLQEEVFEKERRIFELRTLAEKCTAYLSPEAGGEHDDRSLENIVAQIAVLEEEKHDLEIKQEKTAKEISDIMACLSNSFYITLLRERFLEFRTVELIAREHHYTARYIYKLLCQAKTDFAFLYHSLQGDK